MGTASPRRFYIDRDTQQNEPIVRTVTVRRSPKPATHQAEPVGHGEDHRRDRNLLRVGKFVQSAMRRRTS